MPPRRAAESGLADDQLARLVAELADGKRPRVRLSGSQFPDGMSGTVLRIGDPATDGDDFVLVQVKVHGVTDELRFSPRELSVGRRPTAAESPPAAPARKARTKAPAAKAAAPKAAVAKTPAAKTPAAKTPAAKSAPPARATRKAPAATPAPAASSTATIRTARRSSPTPTVTITITSSGSSWSVAARRGARAVVKRAEVTPGAVAAIAALLADPSVEEAVAAVNDGARAEAEARADQLRAELAAVEAVLVSHRRP
ncbi:MAG TPA: hypothetical protein VGN18_13680 [Jatrophihabitans sp.]|uniref:hypothetical protein n=1 Tax=Jatrophihabitans sp. TaxID=1932789 RepID=UPI002DF9DAA4|nr:hypothetical protein [Jatrophihabitans sp.]